MRIKRYNMKTTNTDIKLMRICFGGLELQIPEIWNVETETYTEPDGRECAMIDISATEGGCKIHCHKLWPDAGRLRCHNGSGWDL